MDRNRCPRGFEIRKGEKAFEPGRIVFVKYCGEGDLD